ncbi:MAG: TolC family protein [Candidatus Scalindua sp.]|nr:TolC family protein [Candidatus Scalindua sp.]MCR4344701.1 TolC family protein [Candidatus Scalindua sp.]
MIYPVHHIKYVTVVTLIASVLFFTPDISMAEVSDPTRREGRETNSVNLEECIKAAIENNLQIAAARNGLGIAEADRIKASLLFPSNPKVQSKVGSRSTPADRMTDYSVSLFQELQVYGQRRKRINVSNKKIEKVKLEIADVERTVIAKVKTGFYEVLTARDILSLRENVNSIFERLWDATRERYNAGAIAALELNSIKIGYGQARQQLLVAKNNYKNRLLNLKLLLGKPGDEVLNIEGKLYSEKLLISKEDLLASAYGKRPDLKAIEFEKERASQEILLRKVEIIPNPSVSGFFSREEGDNVIVGGQVYFSIPIWDRKQPELKRARTARDTAGINIKYKQLEIQKEVETAFQTFMAAKEGIAIYTDEIIPQVDESLSLNEISYRDGNTSFIEFLTMQKNLLETRATYINTLLDYNKAIINIETVSGERLISNDR